MTAAYELGIIGGTDPGIFEPNSTLTREQMAIMVARVMKTCGVDLTEKAKKNPFNDTGIPVYLSAILRYKSSTASMIFFELLLPLSSFTVPLDASCSYLWSYAIHKVRELVTSPFSNRSRARLSVISLTITSASSKE